jgi:hypothetical protein
VEDVLHDVTLAGIALAVLMLVKPITRRFTRLAGKMDG